MIINIVSASGGQGRSTLAALLSRHLAAEYPGKTLLLDACSDGGAEWLLGAQRATAYDMGDVLSGRCCVDDAVYPDNGLYIMPPAADDADVRADAMAGLLGELVRSFDFIVLDSPAGFYSFMACTAAASGVTLLCTMGDDFHLAAASRLRRRLPAEDERCRLVLTRYSVKALRDGRVRNIDRCIDRVGARLIGVMPKDNSRPLTDPRSRIDAAVRNIALRLLGGDVPLMKLT